MIRRRPLAVALALAFLVALTGACNKGSGGGLSPTDTMKAYYDAAAKKDVVALKRYLSTGTMKLMEEGAKKMGKSVDDALKESAASTPATATPKFSNEKITGDNATVDISAEGQTVTMPLVKEGGEWKIAMDKFIDDLKTKMGGMSEPPSAPPMTTASPQFGDPKMGNSNSEKSNSNSDDEDEHDNGNH